MIAGRATAEGTARFAKRFPKAKHFRTWNGLTLSSLGVGTYLGEPSEEIDRAYTGAIRRAFAVGGNVVDTAINYRWQHSELAVGAALKDVARDEVFVSTKAGFLTARDEAPARDVVAGCHCMTPAYLRQQLEKSRRNLGVETIDLFYVHNPETQLAEKSRDEFLKAVADAFAVLEEAARGGQIGWYGTATWNGYRVPDGSDEHLSFEDLWSAAERVGGPDHRFRAIQLPLNMAMREALEAPTQGGVPLLEAASKRGMLVMSSASILQGRLAGHLAEAIGFARNAPGLTTALVGMSRAEHVDANFGAIA